MMRNSPEIENVICRESYDFKSEHWNFSRWMEWLDMTLNETPGWDEISIVNISSTLFNDIQGSFHNDHESDTTTLPYTFHLDTSEWLCIRI